MPFSTPRNHPNNRNLRLVYSDTFRGEPVCHRLEYGSSIDNYLARLHDTMTLACQAHTRTFAIRADLRLPDDHFPPDLYHDNQRLDVFFRRLRYELDQTATYHDPDLRYVWAREHGLNDKPHFHLLLLFNYNAIRNLGKVYPTPDGGYNADNLYHRLVRAWAAALGRDLTAMNGLVNITRQTDGRLMECLLHAQDRQTFTDLFYIASYLCKTYSKPIGRGFHVFGASRG